MNPLVGSSNPPLSMEGPEVSIITPCFNAEKTLGRTVNSVISQSFKKWELILVDDKSTDATYKKALELAKTDDRIKVVQLEKNGGAAKARNLGIKISKGRFIAFIDSDDKWHKDKLQIQISLMKKNGCPLSYTAYTKLSETGKHLNVVGVPSTVNYRQLLKTNYIGCSTAIYDSHALGKFYMPDIRRRQDYGLWLSILKTISSAQGINTPLTDYLVHDESLSSNKRTSASYNWVIYRKIENLSLLSSVYYFLQYAIRGVLRTKAPGLSIRLGILHNPISSDQSLKSSSPSVK